MVFSDAVFAWGQSDMKSTSGVCVSLYGNHSFFPLAGQRRKQTAVRHSTAEAEIIAADHALRIDGMPAISLWEKLLDRTLQLGLYQDNQATAKIMLTGRAPTLRHIKRTQGAFVARVHERVVSDDVDVHHCMSSVMAADSFAMHFASTDKRASACQLMLGLAWGGFAKAEDCNVPAVCASGGSVACCAIIAPCRLPSIMASSSTDTAKIEADAAYTAPLLTRECLCAVPQRVRYRD